MVLWECVLCLGDSLTYGARDEYGRGYPAELADMLHERDGRTWICLNEGINGERSSDLLRRASRVLLSRKNETIITLLIGTNDSKDPPTPAEIYRRNVAQVLRIGSVSGHRFVVGLLPRFGKRMNTPYDHKNSSYIDTYNSVLRQLVQEHSLASVDFTDMGEMTVDGIHFGNAGYREMAKRWADTIVRL